MEGFALSANLFGKPRVLFLLLSKPATWTHDWSQAPQQDLPVSGLFRLNPLLASPGDFNSLHRATANSLFAASSFHSAGL